MHGSMKKFVTTHAWARWCTALPGAYEKVRDHSYAWASCGGLTNTIIMKISRPVRFKAGGVLETHTGREPEHEYLSVCCETL